MFTRITDQIVVNPEHVQQISELRFKKNGTDRTMVRIQFVSGHHIDFYERTLDEVMKSVNGAGQLEPRN